MGDVNLPRKSAPPRQWDDYFRDDQERRNLELAREFGYYSMQTGGGCTALEGALEPTKDGVWYVWITDSGGCGVQADPDERDFLLGLYLFGADHGESFRSAEGLTLLEACRMGMLWLHDTPSKEDVEAVEREAEAAHERFKAANAAYYRRIEPWQVL